MKERFSQLVATMSPRDRRLFMGLILLLYLGVLGGFWYVTQGILSDVRSRVDLQEQTVATLAGLSGDQAEAAEAATRIEAELQKNAGTDLSTFAEKAAQKVGIATSLQVRERETTTEGNLESRTYTVDVQKVTLTQVKDFLYELEGTSYPLKISGARFKTTTQAGAKVLSVTLDITAYKLLDAVTEETP